MRICRYLDPETGRPALGAVTEQDTVAPLRRDDEPFADIDAWLAQPDALAAARDAVTAALSSNRSVGRLAHGDPALSHGQSVVRPLAPFMTQEIWGAGVTYERSKVARMEESASGGSFYDLVYSAERPEIFFKSTPTRAVGPFDPIRIRRDSTWNVPEPELTLVVSAGGEIVGYTIGNDVSSRSIEGENPLYLPQAKTYQGCCAVGPVIRLAGDADPREWTIRLTIDRNDSSVFEGEIAVARMRRSPEELVEYLFRDQTFPQGVFLLTGTGIVPPDEFTLESGDLVEIAVDGIGSLINRVA